MSPAGHAARRPGHDGRHVPRQSAVIDLGSNSFRLVVFVSADGAWRRTDEIHEAVRIGEGLAATGKLAAKPMARAHSTLEVFAHFCAATGLAPDDIDAVATSAIRDASNADEFLQTARRTTGLPIRVLSREQEARAGYLAAVNSTTLADGCVLDLGGGSMQLVAVEGRHAAESHSWRLGAVRMTERFLAGEGTASRKQLDRLRAHALTKLERAPWLARTGPRLVGIGGTVRNLAAAAQRRAGLPSLGVQGHCVSAAVLDELIDELAGRAPADRAKVPGIKLGRADLILAGAVVIRAAMEAGGFEAMETTEAGLREGVFFARHLQEEGDPPLFADVRRASVANLAARYAGDRAHIDHVGRLALGLFDELAGAGLHAGDPIERELLWAACELHDIGMSVDYDDHHKHSRYLVLNAGLPGFSPAEVVLVAQTARYHRKGMPEAGPLSALLDGPRDAGRLDRMAVLVRLAEDLERSRDQAVTAAHVRVRGDTVELELEGAGQQPVERWAAGREVDLFARAFGRTLKV